jgi:hypothetical protein
MCVAKMSKLISDIEYSQLKQFVHLVLDMEKTRFIQRAKTQRHDIYIVGTSLMALQKLQHLIMIGKISGPF